MARYVGKRIVPKHCGYWDNTKTYEMENIVYDRASGNSYMSRKAVPAGTDISQEEYWALCSDFNMQMDLLEKHFTATEQRIVADNDATEAAIRADNDETEQAIQADNQATREHVDESLAETTTELTQRVTTAQNAMTAQKASFDATAQQLNARMDEVLAAGTGDGQTEIVDARMDAEGTTHESLGAAIRSIHPKVSDEMTARMAFLPFMAHAHDGYYLLWASGRLARQDGACYTDKIPCKEGDVFHVLSNGYMQGCAALLFHNDTIVGHYGDDDYEHTGAALNYDITIPEAVNWIQFSCITKSRGFSVSKEQGGSYIGVIKDIHDDISDLGFRADNIDAILEDIVVHSVNLFNKDDERNMHDSYMEGSGTIRELSRAAMTHPIQASEGVTYKWSVNYTFWGGPASYLVIADADGNAIRSASATVSEDHTFATYTPTANCYLRVKSYYPTIDSFMFCREDEWPEEFVPYYTKMRYADLDEYAKTADVESMLEPLATKENVKEFQRNVLYGKSVVFDGDSIGQGSSTDGNWAKIIGTANNMDWHNHSVGGGTITAEIYNSSGSPRHWVSRYIDTIHQNYESLDYLIFEGGTNDNDLIGSAGIGTLDVTDFSGNYDDTNFTGALDSLFFKATSYYPTAKIGFIVAQRMGAGTTIQNSRRNYFLRAIEVCKKWGIPYIDLWEGSPLNPKLKCYYDSSLDSQGNRDAGKSYIDGQHLTATGYAIVSSKIEAWMRTL